MTTENEKKLVALAEILDGGRCAVDAGFGPAPLAVRLSFEANRGTPAMASMIARVLFDAGATVTFGNNTAEMPDRSTRNLLGLHVHIDRLTWVRDEEAQRWTDRPNAKVRNGHNEHGKTL